MPLPDAPPASAERRSWPGFHGPTGAKERIPAWSAPPHTAPKVHGQYSSRRAFLILGFGLQAGIEFTRRDNRNSLDLPEHEQVFIAADQTIRMAANSESEDLQVIRISADSRRQRYGLFQHSVLL